MTCLCVESSQDIKEQSNFSEIWSAHNCLYYSFCSIVQVFVYRIHKQHKFIDFLYEHIPILQVYCHSEFIRFYMGRIGKTVSFMRCSVVLFTGIAFEPRFNNNITFMLTKPPGEIAVMTNPRAPV